MKPETPGLGERLFRHFLAIFFCLVLPAFVTWIAPVTWTTFSRQDGRVSMQSRVCLFFLIPYRREAVENVAGLSTTNISGTTSKVEYGSAEDRRRTVTSESTAFLIVRGQEGDVKILVSPASLENVQRKARAFLDDPAATQLRMFTPSNWKFSVFVGGFFSLFTLIYLIGLLSLLFPASRRKKRGERRRAG